MTAYVVAIRAGACDGKGECVRVCPVSILALEVRGPRARCVVSGPAGRCLGCVVCVAVCPTGAITVMETMDGPGAAAPHLT